MDGKLRGGKTHISQNSREFSPEQNNAGLESISQTVQKVTAFSNIGLQKFKMAAGSQNGGFFYVAWQIDFYCQEVYLCQRGCL
jgi:hypothetical protein